MERLSRALRASLDATGAIEHALTRGEIREAEVIEGLRPHIPARFRLATGEVINGAGSHSRQQDVIVSDQFVGTPFLARGGIGVFPVEIVCATLQVKSRIGVATVAAAVENLASVKRLVPNDPRSLVRLENGIRMAQTVAKPFGGIIAFASESRPEALAEAYFKANQAIPVLQDRCNALVVLDEFALLWATEDPERGVVLHPSAGDPTAESDYLDLIEVNAFLLFYLLLQKWLAEYPAPKFDLTGYVGEEKLPHNVFTLPGRKPTVRAGE